MRRVQRLLRSVDRVQQRSRWLGFPLAVMGKFRDDHGGALTTVIAYNAFFAFFLCCWSWSPCSGSCSAATPASSSACWARRWPTSPSSATRFRTTFTGCAAAASAWWSACGLRLGARGLTQVAQHAMAEIWNIPQAAARLLGPAGPGLLLLVVFAGGLAATSLLTWLGSYGGKAVAVALANLVAAAAVNVGLFLLVFRC